MRYEIDRRTFNRVTAASITIPVAHRLGLTTASAQAETVITRASLDPELIGFVDNSFTTRSFPARGKRLTNVIDFEGKRMVIYQTVAETEMNDQYQSVPILNVMSDRALDNQLLKGDFGAQIPKIFPSEDREFGIPDLLQQRVQELKERRLDPGRVTAYGQFGKFQVWRFESMAIHFDGTGFENLLIGEVLKNASAKYPYMLLKPEDFLPRPVTDQAPTTGVTYAKAGDIQSLIVELSNEYGGPTQSLLNIAWCESKFNPKAKNDRSNARGLFQFIPSTWRDVAVPYLRSLGITNPDVEDPVHNTLAAIHLYKKGGPGQWVCLG